MDEHATTQEVAGAVPAAPHKDNSLMSPDVTMLVLTWVTFFLLLAVLQKFAWKPIINALEKRENDIRKSLEDADKVKAQLAELEVTRTKVLEEARQQAAQIVDEARKSALILAHDIEAKARLNAQEIVKNGEIQIEGQRRQARETLKKESVHIAIELASKILKENTDIERNRRLVDAAIPQL